MIGCEFCDELDGRKSSRFESLYHGLARSRLAVETAHFAALPTLGQIFTGSMLVIPKAHVETSARIPARLRTELAELLARVFAASRRFGDPVLFEHGALSCTGGSCGIYHAHLHVVPLPAPVPPAQFLDPGAATAARLEDALADLEESEQYLLFGGEAGIAYADVADLPFTPPSQYFRRRLAEHFGAAADWDWRRATGPEPALLETLSHYGAGDVPDRARAGA